MVPSPSDAQSNGTMITSVGIQALQVLQTAREEAYKLTNPLMMATAVTRTLRHVQPVGHRTCLLPITAF